ncbi:glycosyltransferase family 39 protein, partial [bacterium]|nr:glycosyltransferase family 39 protein [bacterium]
MKKWWVNALGLLVLGGIAAFLRHPVVDEIFCDPDVAGVAYSSQELLDGGSLYGDTVETKFPGAYFLFAGLTWLFGRSMIVYYVASIAMHLLTMLALFYLNRKKPGAGLATAFLYAFYSTSASTNGLCPNFETWTVLPIALGFAGLDRFSIRQHLLPVALAGCSLGIAILFKQTAAVFGLVMVAGLWLLGDRTREAAERVGAFLRDAAVFCVGAAVPLIAMFSFFAYRDELEDLGRVFGPNAIAGYVSTEPLATVIGRFTLSGGRFLFQHKVLLLLFLVFLVFSPLNRRQRGSGLWDKSAAVIAALWLTGAAMAVFAGTKFFGHYFVLLTAPLCLAGGQVVGLLFVVRRIPTVAAGIGAALVALGTMADMRVEIRTAQKGMIDRVETGSLYWVYTDNFWRDVALNRYSHWSRQMRDVGECIEAKTSVEDRIYVWDYEPGVYWYADRRAPTRHFMYFNVAVDLPKGSGRWHSEVNPHVVAARAQLIGDLQAHPPTHIVVVNPLPEGEPDFGFYQVPAPVFPTLRDFVNANYVVDTDCTN